MKLNLLNIALFLAFLIILAITGGAGWYLFGNLSGWNTPRGEYHEMGQEETGSETFKGNIDSLSVKAVAGSVDVESWDGEGIMVNYRKMGMTREALEKINVRMEQKGTGLDIWTEFPPGPRISSGWVEYDIRIPSGLEKLEAKSVSGSIKIGRQTGISLFEEIDQRLETTSGPIFTAGADDLDISSVSGSLEFTAGGKRIDAETVSGRISGIVTGDSEDQRINAESVSGSLKLDLSEEWTGDIGMKSISGSLRSNLPVVLEKQNRTSLEGRIGQGTGRARLHTTSGSITLE